MMTIHLAYNDSLPGTFCDLKLGNYPEYLQLFLWTTCKEMCFLHLIFYLCLFFKVEFYL